MPTAVLDRARHRWRKAARLLAAGVVTTAGAVQAQVPGAGLATDPLPAGGRPALPPVRPPAPAPGFELPPLPRETQGGAPLSSQLRLQLRGFTIDGNTVLSPEQIEAVAAPYVGRLVTATDLHALRRALTLLYVENGYITSGVTIPDQDVRDGIVRLQVVEGRLVAVALGGDRRLHDRYLLDLLGEPVGGQAPLHVNTLKERLVQVQLDPLVERVQGQLQPGERLGESVLALEVDEVRPIALAFAVNNHVNPSVGPLQGELDVSLRDLSGFGEVFNVHLRKAQGLRDGAVRLTVPLAADGPRVSAGYRASESRVVEEPFDNAQARGTFEELVVSIRHDLLREPQRAVEVAANLAYRRSQSFVFGEPFRFSPGVDDEGRSRVTVARLRADYSQSASDTALAVRSTVSIGLDALGATINRDAPDGRFVSWLGQVQYAKRLGFDGAPEGAELRLRGDIQLSGDDLLPLERFGVGGASSVRGYRENQLVRDSGWAASAELRLPVLGGVDRIGQWRLAAFVDAGGAWNKGGTPPPRSLSSAGLGLLWRPAPGWSAELYGALPFRNIDNDGDELQDAGVHFSLQYQQ